MKRIELAVAFTCRLGAPLSLRDILYRGKYISFFGPATTIADKWRPVSFQKTPSEIPTILLSGFSLYLGNPFAFFFVSWLDSFDFTTLLFDTKYYFYSVKSYT